MPDNAETAKRTEILVKILREEYGINSEAELDEELKRMPGINLAPFVRTPQPPARSASVGVSTDSP